MKPAILLVLSLIAFCQVSPISQAATGDVKELSFAGPNNVTIKLRMEGPYTAEVPLQVVCYFKFTSEGARRMAGAPVELDKELGGVIGELRKRGEFEGETLETVLIVPPTDSIKAKSLLLIGLGDEAELSTELLEDVGKVALREATRLGASPVAFAPLIRDQGNTAINAGAVERSVTLGMLLAYDTQRRLQKEGFANPYTLEQWNIEAGPTYFDDTKTGVEQGIKEAQEAIAKRSTSPYAVAQ